MRKNKIKARKGLISENLGYTISGFICKGFNCWRVTAVKSGNVYHISIAIEYCGGYSDGIISENDNRGKEIGRIRDANYRKCINFIREREGIV